MLKTIREIFAFVFNGVVILSRKADGKHFPRLSFDKMGMIHNNISKGTQTERDNMPPERLSAWLDIKKDTLYKAYKIVGKGKWKTGAPLLAADVDALVLYYADRNERAKAWRKRCGPSRKHKRKQKKKR